MRTPFEKLKKADKGLKTVMVICLLLGLYIIGIDFYLYFKNNPSNLWDKQLPDSIYKPLIKGSLVVDFVVLPALGILLILAAYTIWNYRRKREMIKEHDKTDA